MLINIKDLMNICQPISDEQIHEEIKSVVMGGKPFCSEPPFLWPPQTKSMKAEFN